MQEYVTNMAIQWVWWAAGEIIGGLGVGGMAGLAAGCLLLLSLSAKAMKFFTSPRGMAVTAAVMMAGVGFMWWSWGKVPARPTQVASVTPSKPKRKPAPKPAELKPEPEAVQEAEAAIEPEPARKLSRRQRQSIDLPEWSMFGEPAPIFVPPLPVAHPVILPPVHVAGPQHPLPHHNAAMTHHASVSPATAAAAPVATTPAHNGQMQTGSTLPPSVAANHHVAASQPNQATVPPVSGFSPHFGGGTSVSASAAAAHQAAMHAAQANGGFPAGSSDAGAFGGDPPHQMTAAQMRRHDRVMENRMVGQMMDQMFNPWNMGQHGGMEMHPMGGMHPMDAAHHNGMGHDGSMHGNAHMPAGGMSHPGGRH